jgi:hypothetical protein
MSWLSNIIPKRYVGLQICIECGYILNLDLSPGFSP